MINSKNILAYAPIVIAYTTLCGCLWQLGYWSTFKFNYLEYISVQDVFKASIYPFISKMWYYFALILFPIAFAPLATELMAKKEVTYNEEISEPKVFGRLLHIIIFISGSLAFFFSGLIFSSTLSITLFPICTAILIGCLLYKTDLFKNQIKDYILRLFILSGLAIFPALNLVVAKQESVQAKLMFRYKRVDYIVTSDSTLNSYLSKTAYLGSTSEFHFFGIYETVLVVKNSEVKLMAISTHTDDRHWMDYYNYKGRIF